MAKHFYLEMIPELEELADQGDRSGDAAKAAAAQTLRAKLEEVLSSENHLWSMGKLSPEEREERRKRQEEFRQRYGN